MNKSFSVSAHTHNNKKRPAVTASVPGSLIRRIFILFLIAGVGLSTPVFSYKTASAATVVTQPDEYKSEISDYIETSLNEQLVAYFSGSDGTKASVGDPTKSGYRSSISFPLDFQKISGLNIQMLLEYVSEAITSNPNLCTLSTDIQTTGSYNSITLTINSVIPKGEHLQAIRGYKSFLADL